MFLETLKVVDGEVLHLEYHQQRVDAVFRSFDKYPSLELQNYISDIPKPGIYRCRVVYDLALRVFVEFLPYTVKNIKTLKLIEANHIDYRYKYSDREQLQQLFEQRGVCDDVLIIKNGCVTDTSIANIALYDGTRWVTPKNPLLEGTTRRRYIENGFLKEKVIKIEDLQGFTQVALLNAMVDFAIIPQDNLEDIVC